MSYAEKGNCGGVRDEVLPWILSKHPYSLEPCPQLGEDRITLSPFAVQLYEIYVQLEVVFEPQQRFRISRRHDFRRYGCVWKDGAVEEGIWRLTEAYDAILQA